MADVPELVEPEVVVHGLANCDTVKRARKWLAANAYTYGFIIRYASDKTSVTGYQYEPWHFRYVGIDLARELHQKDTTLEEYFEIQ